MKKVSQIGQQIIALKDEKKTSLFEIGRKVKVTPQTMTNIVRGHANPSMKVLKDIAAGYDKNLIVMFVDKT